MVSEKAGAEKIIEQINSTNAKRAALLLVLGFAFYHELLHIRYGGHICHLNSSNITFLPLSLQAVIRANGCYRTADTRATKNGNLMAA